MNNNQRKTEEPLREVRKWKEKVSKKTKSMTMKEVIQYFANAVNEFKKI